MIRVIEPGRAFRGGVDPASHGRARKHSRLKAVLLETWRHRRRGRGQLSIEIQVQQTGWRVAQVPITTNLGAPGLAFETWEECSTSPRAKVGTNDVSPATDPIHFSR